MTPNATMTDSFGKVWTLETVFKNPERDPDGLWAVFPPGMTTARFTSEFKALVDSEKAWVRYQPIPMLPDDVLESVGTLKQPCPVCNDEGRVPLLHRGEVTGISMLLSTARCLCAAIKTYWSHWSKVPERFRDVRFDEVKPRGAKQKAILAKLRESPDGSYLLWGVPGTGKSHFAMALYDHACRQVAFEQYQSKNAPMSGPIWRVETSALLAEHAKYATSDPEDPGYKVPSVTREAIVHCANHGFRPRLFLEEIDKFGFTEARVNTLCAIVNAVYEAKGQVVATSNKSGGALEKKWGADEGGTLIRRITGDGGWSIRFGD